MPAASRPVSTAGGAAAGLPGCGVPAADSAGGAAVDSRAPQRTYDHAAMITTTATTTATNVTTLIAPWSDPVELVELQRRSLEREHLKRETPVQVVQARLALETLQEPVLHAPLDRPMPVHELTPQGHVPKSTAKHVSGRQVRRRKQTAVSLDIVQPGRANHADRLSHGPLDVIEEGGEVRHSLTSALDPQRGESIRLGVAEVEADAIIA